MTTLDRRTSKRGKFQGIIQGRDRDKEISKERRRKKERRREIDRFKDKEFPCPTSLESNPDRTLPISQTTRQDRSTICS